jgi:diacylglycerol kinase
MADMITREEHPQIKFIKDLAAGAVLVAALVAVVVGLFIFIPKII